MNIIKKSEATYILVINISEDLKIRVGQLGEAFFKEGDYIYIGSAKDSLDARLRRHLRKDKKTYWHIDYLLENQKVKILQIWTIDKKVECQTAEVFYQEPITKIIKKGFGSSDCKCLTHLFFVKDKKKTEKILKKIGFSAYYSFSKFKIDNPLL
ncbi:MAG: GIY-YIG nuclease family protein [Candidatus Atribacteria bacterium]|nr:GIY-YIG nuclease family protein [Candidatus Atribacteria bacterium]